MGRIPLELDEGEGWHVTPHGGFAARRLTDADGACGISAHPCTHWGVDLAAPGGTAVVAPERGEVWYSMASPMLRPLRGYQPGAVLLRGVSGMTHVLGHLVNLALGDHRDTAPPQGGWAVVEEGQKLGEVSPAAGHTHWEIRATPFRQKGMLDAAFYVDPEVWLRMVGNDPDASALRMMTGLGRKAAGAVGGGAGWLLLVGLALYASERGHR
jgi:murein DD-endopeptidase MepM/ murein hydrolase activator NlpD